MRSSPFILLCTTGLFAIFSSTISKSPVLPLFSSHLGADPAGVGFVASVSAFTGIVASIPAGLLSDKYGRKRMLLISSAVFATAPVLYLFVENIWQLSLVRFYHGFATAIFLPVAMALIADLFEKERGEKIGWFSTSTLLGRFIAPLAGGAVLGLLASNPAKGFKAVYVLCGITGMIAFALVFFRLPRDEGAGLQGSGWADTFRSFRSAAGNRLILVTSLAEAAVLFAYGTFETFLPLHALERGESAFSIGIFLSSQVMTLALTKPFMGRFSDRHGRVGQIVAGAGIGAVSVASFGLFSGFLSFLLNSMLFGLSLSIVTSATAAYIADLSRQQNLGSAMGILGSIMDMGHTTGPLVAGFLAASWGFRASFIGASAVLAGAVLLFWIITGGSKKAVS